MDKNRDPASRGPFNLPKHFYKDLEGISARRVKNRKTKIQNSAEGQNIAKIEFRYGYHKLQYY